MDRILVTGGAGFVGSSLGLTLKEKYPKSKIFAFDSLRRRGSELTLPRLKKAGIEFVHGDVRIMQDIQDIGGVDLIVDCAAEPSVAAGLDGSTQFLVDTNLGGTVSLLELAKKSKSVFMLMSTSRVYPFKVLNGLPFEETPTRFHFTGKTEIPGLSSKGVSEDFPMQGTRTLYGATKLASEMLLEEYATTFSFPYIINRCSVIAGPWQMGKVDQGFLVLWVARHIFGGTLKYTGFGGKGKQVRDLIHVRDLGELLLKQLDSLSTVSGEVFNIGGGADRMTSLLELTQTVQDITKNKIEISSSPETHMNDCIYFCADNSKAEKMLSWSPKATVKDLVIDIYNWISSHKDELKGVLGN